MGKRAVEYATMISADNLDKAAAEVSMGLISEVHELIAARKAKTDEARAAAVMDTYKKANAISRILAKEGIDPKVITSAFAAMLGIVDEKLYKLCMHENLKVCTNRRLLKKFPTIAVQPEGFKKMHEAMQDKSGRLWLQLLNPKKKQLRKHREEGVINMVRRNIRLYWVDPMLGGTGEPIHD